MKTLYISDLDGTLLDGDAALSPRTVSGLNRLIANGLNFSVATARTAATADGILKDLALNIPMILMNGVLIYDKTSKHYIKKETIPYEAVTRVINAMHTTGVDGMMYGLDNDRLVTYYENIGNGAMRAFIDERVTKFGKKFTKVPDVSVVTAGIDIIYFCFIDKKERIDALKSAIGEIDGLRTEMYQDIYTDGDIWYLEAFSSAASKRNAVLYLKKAYGFDKVVAFGDNLNDLPMFEVADEAYAVANAKPEVKAKATAVIQKNTQNAVVTRLENINNN